MSFPEKYQLLEALAGEGTESYRARQTRGGREVTAHFLPGGKSSEQTKALMARLLKLPPQSMAKVLEVSEYKGRSLVVIVAPPFLHFDEWLNAEEPAAQAGLASGPPGNAHPPQPASPAPGEMTGLFRAQSPDRQALAERPSPPGGSTELDVTACQGQATFSLRRESEPPATKPPEPGEFTQLFQAASPDPVSAAPRAAPSQGEWPASAPKQSEPGEFTRLFQAVPQAPVSAAPSASALPASSRAAPSQEWPAPTSKPSEAGEFTRALQARPPAGSVPEGPMQAKPLPSEMFSRQPPAPSHLGWDQPAAQPSGQGEYTRLFQSVQPATPGIENQIHAMPPAPAVAHPEGDFTRMLRGPEAPPPTPVPQAPVAQALSLQPAAPAMPSGPSEYTRLMAAPPVPAASAFPPAPAAARIVVPPMPQAPQLPQMAPPAVPQPGVPANAAPATFLLLAIGGLIGFLAGVLFTFLLMRH